MLYIINSKKGAIDLSTVTHVQKIPPNGLYNSFRLYLFQNFKTDSSSYRLEYETEEERDAEFDSMVLHINGNYNTQQLWGLQTCS